MQALLLVTGRPKRGDQMIRQLLRVGPAHLTAPVPAGRAGWRHWQERAHFGGIVQIGLQRLVRSADFEFAIERGLRERGAHQGRGIGQGALGRLKFSVVPAAPVVGAEAWASAWCR